MASRLGSAPSPPRTAMANAGVPVDASRPGSPAARAGIRRGDIIVTIDGHQPLDSIDADIMTAEASFELTVIRAGRRQKIRVARREGVAHGMTFAPPPMRTCVNQCPFCYVDQFPTDQIFRSGLGIYDDDYRHSFLFGNYVTLTNLSPADLDRIVALRLSPLYVSVHATDPEVRARILGRRPTGGRKCRGRQGWRRSDPRVAIMPTLRRLAEAGIIVHAQIVLVRGVNDGRTLRRSLDELHSLHTEDARARHAWPRLACPSVKTVAIVPVGLTAHHRGGIPPWTPARARRALPGLLALARRYPPGFAQLADEWFVLSKKDPPAARHYGDFDVIEDGVGLVRRLLDDWKKITLPKRVPESRDSKSRGSKHRSAKTSGLLITGRSPERFIRRIVRRMNRIPGVAIEIGVCENRTFGAPTTVTGLLAWRDIRPVIEQSSHKTVFIPDVLLDRENRFLDGVTLGQARRESGRTLRVIATSAEGFLEILENEEVRNAGLKTGAPKGRRTD